MVSIARVGNLSTVIEINWNLYETNRADSAFNQQSLLQIPTHRSSFFTFSFTLWDPISCHNLEPLVEIFIDLGR